MDTQSIIDQTENVISMMESDKNNDWSDEIEKLREVLTNFYQHAKLKHEMNGEGEHRIAPNGQWTVYGSPAWFSKDGRHYVAFTQNYLPWCGNAVMLESDNDYRDGNRHIDKNYDGPWAERVYELVEVKE